MKLADLPARVVSFLEPLPPVGPAAPKRIEPEWDNARAKQSRLILRRLRWQRKKRVFNYWCKFRLI